MRQRIISSLVVFILSLGIYAKDADVLIIDVRTEAEWNSGYLENAIHIPLDTIEKNIILTIHSHRESPSGLIVRKVKIENDKFEILDELDLFKNENMGSDSTNISKQFGSLKFGQPSLIKLQNNEVFATCWCYENNQHIIKSFIVNL